MWVISYGLSVLRGWIMYVKILKRSLSELPTNRTDCPEVSRSDLDYLEIRQYGEERLWWARTSDDAPYFRLFQLRDTLLGGSSGVDVFDQFYEACYRAKWRARFDMG